MGKDPIMAGAVAAGDAYLLRITTRKVKIRTALQQIWKTRKKQRKRVGYASRKNNVLTTKRK